MSETLSIWNSISPATVRKELVRHARDGNPAAIEHLIVALPAALPARALVAYRDAHIRAVAGWLSVEHPSLSRRGLAEVLKGAGDAIAAGRAFRRTDGEGQLPTADQIELRAKLLPAADLAIPGRTWPTAERIRSICRSGL